MGPRAILEPRSSARGFVSRHGGRTPAQLPPEAVAAYNEVVVRAETGQVRNYRSLAHAAVLGCLLFGLSPTAVAEVPELRNGVNDYAGLLPPAQVERLAEQLRLHEQNTGHKLVLLTVRSLEGQSIEQLGHAVAERWQRGDQRRDDGLILIVVKEDRAARIEAGAGLEGVVPNAVAERIIAARIAPLLKLDLVGEGIPATMYELIRATGGEVSRPPPRPPRVRPSTGAPHAAPRAHRSRDPSWYLLLLVWALVFIFVGVRGQRRQSSSYRFRGGRSGSGNHGGGGRFRGGGGRFGGGGASGRW